MFFSQKISNNANATLRFQYIYEKLKSEGYFVKKNFNQKLHNFECSSRLKFAAKKNTINFQNFLEATGIFWNFRN